MVYARAFAIRNTNFWAFHRNARHAFEMLDAVVTCGWGRDRMIATRFLSDLGCACVAIIILAVAYFPQTCLTEEPAGTLQLTITDSATGSPVPARV